MEQKDGINKFTNDQKQLVKIILSDVTIVNYLMYFEIKLNQPFLLTRKRFLTITF